MKYLYTLSLSLLLFGFITSCKKSAETNTYQSLPDSGTYTVKSGTITLGSPFAVTYTAPEDVITVNTSSYGLSIIAYRAKSVVPRTNILLSIVPLPGDQRSAQDIQLFRLDYFETMSKGYSTHGQELEFKGTDFNNIETGVLLTGDLTAALYQTPGTDEKVVVTGSIDLKLNKK
ncbi:hypothetical protein [Mucilaginibacter myungsuensis]|uniref:Uncharacterized protein n=1 Tax=Mucilaginibacter myungsuensis TaxID=649104 RepID=A0A929L1B5_9SPHI|nr:hypothetical protein [Mucilaginibacter myungsuensis]MBE9664397.1 hypothetical protein [Mucilaginibacter myungsuensis]MDN3597108.1 hypothetical protein [Mucilaginibacter myungsuensis]